ncbi:hypothetical protein C5F50_06980 [Nitrosopumilus ureiphilus]|uniref:Uncharacterized protein n=1 Tax=Nitrosopumilus ureiphilus TaxID=1470067 RepID=A0A7D5M890_9ARCH|nr:hypothetical protein C5F50_06980 [Nitrosopumilus ureiphilus]
MNLFLQQLEMLCFFFEHTLFLIFWLYSKIMVLTIYMANKMRQTNQGNKQRTRENSASNHP